MEQERRVTRRVENLRVCLELAPVRNRLWSKVELEFWSLGRFGRRKKKRR